MKNKTLKILALCLVLAIALSCVLSVSAAKYVTNVISKSSDYAAFVQPGDTNIDKKVDASDYSELREMLLYNVASRYSDVKIKAGSILEAQYIDIAETDFQLEDIQLRADGNANDPAIRFVINKNKAFEGKINPTQYGAIFMEADKAQGLEIFMDKSPVVAWYAYANESGNNEEWAVRETTGYKPYTFVADPEKILE